MDDDDEIQSNPTSPGSESPSSPPPSGRITVTVAAAPPHSNTLTLALPIQQQQQLQSQPQQRIGGPGGGREDCWSEGATGVLIDAWGERYLELSRGNLKQKHWKEVADVVSSREDYNKTPKTDIQCKNRIDTVKKKYKLEKAKISSGGGPSKWPFYEKLDELIGSTAKIAGTSAPVVPKGVPVGIPVGVRSVHQFKKQQPQQQQQKPKQFKRRALVESESSPSEPDLSPDSTDSFPPETYVPKRPRVQPREMNLSEVRQAGAYLGGTDKAKEEDKVKDSSNWGNSVRELTRAILKFGEAYEHAESAKLQQLVEMEKQRMKFTKEMELQRMQFFMKTQLELSQLKRMRGGNSSSSNHHRGNNSNTINGDNNSDNSSH